MRPEKKVKMTNNLTVWLFEILKLYSTRSEIAKRIIAIMFTSLWATLKSPLRFSLALIFMCCLPFLSPCQSISACCSYVEPVVVNDQTQKETQGNEDDQKQDCVGSTINVASGNLTADFSTPPVPTIQGIMQVSATYSNRYETTSVPIKSELVVSVGGLLSAEWTIQVVDRSWTGTGQMASAVWDTTYNDGTPVPEGTYPYLITATITYGAPSSPTTFTNSTTGLANVLRGYNGPVGYNWTFNYNQFIKENADGSLTMVDQDGTLLLYQFNLTYDDGNIRYSKYYPSQRITPILYKIEDLSTGSYSFRLDDKYGNQSFFNQGGRLTSIVEKGQLGLTTRTYTFNYDGSGNLTGIVDPSGRSTTFTYSSSRIINITDIAGRNFDLGYDGIGNLTSFTDANGNTTTYSYDATTRNLISKTDPLGNTTSYSYDAEDRLVEVTDAAGNVTTFAFDPINNTSTKTDPRGNVTTYRYNNLGEVVEEIDPSGNRTTYGWNTNKTRAWVTDQRGYTTNFSYDSLLNITKVCNPVACIQVYYYSYSSPFTIYDAKGNITWLFYDIYVNMIMSTNPLGQSTQYTYDDKGQRLTTTDPDGNTTTFSYDTNGNLISQTDAMGNTQTMEYDAAGNLTRATDARGNSTTFVYDNQNNLLQVTYAEGNTISFRYDAMGRMVRLTGPMGGITTFEYDNLGNRVRETDTLGNTHAYSYGCCGLLLSRDGTTYEYDGNNRLIRIAYPDGTTMENSYDASGNMVNMRDATGISTFEYDAANRLIRYTNPEGRQVNYLLDSVGNVTTLTYPEGQTVTYQYDGLNRITQVTDWLGMSTTYQYDSRGNLALKNNINSNSTLSATYDAINRLNDYTDKNFVGSLVISSGSYKYDAEGNVSGIVQQLPLNPAPILSNKNYTYNLANQITSETIGGTSYTHDANGNLIRKTLGAQITDYTYDYEDRLTQIVSPDRTLQYQYDGAGRRTARTVDGVKTGYILDIKPALFMPLAESDADGNIIRYYLYGAQGELLSTIDASGNQYWYHYDHIGNTLALSDISGNLINKYAYDPFGRLAGMEETVSNPFRFVGQFGVMDEGDNLFYMRARYYDPAIGRFINKDPIGLLGGLNMYAYVGNNPIKLIDPLGLQVSNSWPEARNTISTFRNLVQVVTTGGTIVTLVNAGWALVPAIIIGVVGSHISGMVFDFVLDLYTETVGHAICEQTTALNKVLSY